MALSLVGACGGDTGDGAAPRRAPTFSLEDVRRPGTPVTLPEGEPAVLNFLASWCGPCREELPELQRISRDVAVIGVDVADNRGKAVELLEATGVGFPVGYDPQREVAGAYRVNGMPTTVFIAADGTEVGRVQGPVDRATLGDWAERLGAAR
ncbi:MAG: TlpA family protein disulfide reductase [Actinomycetota bacterium]|nr:TlpA family protein disulfide reductase [Actinomycetota bacterium]